MVKCKLQIKSIECIQHSTKKVLKGVQVVSSREAVGANRAEAIVALVVHMESTGVNLRKYYSEVKKYLNLTFVEHQVVPAGWPPYIQSAQELWVTLAG